jgi:hypothetical protein
LTIDRSKLFQAFKYIVYLFLAMNIYWFYVEEVLAAKIQFPNGIGIKVIIEAYAATIDTAAWVVLLLMFELETYVLEDEQFTRPVTWSLHSLRAICYAFIVYAFYGYIANLLTLDGMTPLANVSDLCALAGQWSYSTTLDEYTAITAANCNSFTTATSFMRFDEMQAVVDLEGQKDIIALAWVDVINSAVWLLVVIVLEIDVRLQERQRYEGALLHASNGIKFVLYALLFCAAIYWGINGDFVDFWDAFLWLVAFVFIELNVFEWHKETQEQAMASAGT